MNPIVLRLAVSGLALASFAGCVKNEATGESYFTPAALGGRGAVRSQAIEIGTQAAPEMTQEFGGAVSDQRLQKYVRDIGNKLAAQTEGDNKSYPWEFTLLDSSVINAFALPGGKIFFTRGLAERLTNEAQMAGVLGHEVGHVTADHTMRQIGQALAVQSGLMVAAVAVGASSEGSRTRQTGEALLPALQIGGTLYMLKFGRDEESQADYLGMRYMSRAGYNPRAQVQVMQVLKSAGGGGGGIEMLQTHPLPDTRIRQVNDLLAGEFKTAASDPKNQMYEDRYQREFLSILKTLPPPRQQSEVEVKRLMELAIK